MGLCFAAPVSAATSDVQVGYSGNKFSPVQTNITVGDTVVWTFVDKGHDIDGMGFGTTLKEQPVNSKYSHQFLVSGVYSYFCDFHQGMTGSITVGEAMPPPPPPVPVIPEPPAPAPAPQPVAPQPVVPTHPVSPKPKPKKKKRCRVVKHGHHHHKVCKKKK